MINLTKFSKIIVSASLCLLLSGCKFAGHLEKTEIVGLLSKGAYGGKGTLLKNGKIFISGESQQDVLVSCESCDKSLASEVFSPKNNQLVEAPPLKTIGIDHTASLLQDGQVLLTGGNGACCQQQVNGTGIYDPSLNIFDSTAKMFAPRANHTATVLNDGTVLIVGGNPRQKPSTGNAYKLAELFDPKSRTFKKLPETNYEHVRHIAILLRNGDVLIAGGGNAHAELFDFKKKVFTPLPDMTTPRTSHSAVVLENDNVLIISGMQGEQVLNSGELTETIEEYDYRRKIFTSIKNMDCQRVGATSLLLPNEKVLLIGGWPKNDQCLSDIVVYDYKQNEISAFANMQKPRAGHFSILTQGNKIIIGGGVENTHALQPIFEIEALTLNIQNK